MSKRTVERKLCDVGGCTNDAGPDVCKRCSKDYCWSHAGSIENGSKKLLLCAACIAELVPDVELWAKAFPLHWPGIQFAAVNTL